MAHNILLREFLMRAQYAFPVNEQDLLWFDEGLKPIMIERFCHEAGLLDTQDPDTELTEDEKNQAIGVLAPPFKLEGGMEWKHVNGYVQAIFPVSRDGNLKCPNCGSSKWIAGPRGGLSQNIQCDHCLKYYNDMGPFGLDELSDRSDLWGKKSKYTTHINFTMKNLLAEKKKISTGIEGIKGLIISCAKGKTMSKNQQHLWANYITRMEARKREIEAELKSMRKPSLIERLLKIVKP